ncbi:MAG TPA: hypothetical protein VF109_02490, partial [Mycobacteriales bacterium]
LVAEEGGTPLRAVPALPDQEPQPTLSRRVPQANLAAGLRRDSQDRTEPAPATAVSHPAAARDALSRFQTSQRQAREAVRRGEIPPEDQP